MNHIDFYKVLQLEDGNYKMFEFKKDFVQETVNPKSASFKTGSFIWS